MKTEQTFAARSPLLHIWLGLSDSRVKYADFSIVTHTKTERQSHTIPVDQIADMTVKDGLLTSRLELGTKKGRKVIVDGLAKRETGELVKAVLGDIEERELELAASQDAIGLAARIDAAAAPVEELLRSDVYIRHSRWANVIAPATAISTRCSERVRRHLDRETRFRLLLIGDLADPDRSEARRTEVNRKFLERQAALVADATRDLAPHGMTSEQSRVIATDEDSTLVLAGAGTGKTA